MENEKKLGLFAVNRRKIVGAVVVSTALMFGGSNDSGSQGHDAYVYSPLPQEDFMPLEIQGDLKDTPDELNRDNSPGERVTVVFPSPSESPSLLPSSSISSPNPEVQKPTPKPKATSGSSIGGWVLDPNVSWYGPGFYGNRTACGEKLTKTLIGVANRTLPCGTMVDFRWNGKTIRVPVVDRGPYVAGRIFDLTGGACMAFATPDNPKGHCFTGPIQYRIEK